MDASRHNLIKTVFKYFQGHSTLASLSGLRNPNFFINLSYHKASIYISNSKRLSIPFRANKHNRIDLNIARGQTDLETSDFYKSILAIFFFRNTFEINKNQ